MRTRNTGLLLLLVALACNVTSVVAQQRAAPPAPAKAGASAPAPVPPGYVIGAGDILTISFWRDKDLSAEGITVRPDGMISLPLLNEIRAAGLTPEELRMKLVQAAGKFIDDPDVAVVVKEIRSRNVFITGNVAKPATYPLNNDMTVLQLIAVAGGLQDWADAKNILVVRTVDGRQQFHKFNYKDVKNQKQTAQNIALKPGDTVVVP
jgi:polysaccharide biosynthesis/export protein